MQAKYSFATIHNIKNSKLCPPHRFFRASQRHTEKNHLYSSLYNTGVAINRLTLMYEEEENCHGLRKIILSFFQLTISFWGYHMHLYQQYVRYLKPLKVSKQMKINGRGKFQFEYMKKIENYRFYWIRWNFFRFGIIDFSTVKYIAFDYIVTNWWRNEWRLRRQTPDDKQMIQK